MESSPSPYSPTQQRQFLEIDELSKQACQGRGVRYSWDRKKTYMREIKNCVVLQVQALSHTEACIELTKADLSEDK